MNQLLHAEHYFILISMSGKKVTNFLGRIEENVVLGIALYREESVLSRKDASVIAFIRTRWSRRSVWISTSQLTPYS
jgi:hypothetical protein